MLAALRVAIAAVGFRKLVEVLRRAREARTKPLSRSERLEQSAVAAILLGFAVFMGYLVAPELHGSKLLVVSLLYAAILLVVAGLCLFAASGVTDALGPAQSPPAEPKVRRNEPCPCGSGKKFKHCHGAPVGRRLTSG